MSSNPSVTSASGMQRSDPGPGGRGAGQWARRAMSERWSRRSHCPNDRWSGWFAAVIVELLSNPFTSISSPPVGGNCIGGAGEPFLVPPKFVGGFPRRKTWPCSGLRRSVRSLARGMPKQLDSITCPTGLTALHRRASVSRAA